jgi:flagellar L-ring protein FlgH
MLPFRISIIITSCLLLANCAAIGNIGKTPEMTTGDAIPHIAKSPDISKLKIPSKHHSRYPDGYAAQNYPLDGAEQAEGKGNYASLWQSGPESLFGDRRAKDIGDILTVNIEIDDRAEFNNKTERARDSKDTASIAAGFGVDDLVDKVLPSPLSVKPGLEAEGNQTTKGEGKINRREKLQLKIAALVTNILPNGNLIIQGSQEVNVNYELRDLQITGIVRPHDISRKNTISYEKIAEARIYYGGRGNVSQLQQPRYGSQFFDIVSPF